MLQITFFMNDWGKPQFCRVTIQEQVQRACIGDVIPPYPDFFLNRITN